MERESIETDPEMSGMTELADKTLKVTINMLKNLKENMKMRETEDMKILLNGLTETTEENNSEPANSYINYSK